jgi:hypothetical protein
MITIRHSDISVGDASSPVHNDAGASNESNLKLAPYISVALQTLVEHYVDVEDQQRLTLIVRAALESQTHFFAAALHDPEQDELDRFFNDFVLRCVLPSHARFL